MSDLSVYGRSTAARPTAAPVRGFFARLWHAHVARMKRQHDLEEAKKALELPERLMRDAGLEHADLLVRIHRLGG